MLEDEAQVAADREAAAQRNSLTMGRLAPRDVAQVSMGQGGWPHERIIIKSYKITTYSKDDILRRASESPAR